MTVGGVGTLLFSRQSNLIPYTEAVFGKRSIMAVPFQRISWAVSRFNWKRFSVVKREIMNIFQPEKEGHSSFSEVVFLLCGFSRDICNN